LVVAVRLVFGAPAMVRRPGLAGGALVGGALVGTVGVLGFVEGGFQPAPQASVSVLTEVAILGLLAVLIVDLPRAHQAA
jgi:hypothetical protein